MLGWVHAVLASVLVAATGCEFVFPLDPRGDAAVPPPGDAPPDARPDAAPDATPLCTVGMPVTIPIDASADATLPSVVPDQPNGTLDVVNVGVGIQSRGLFRFALGAIVDPVVQLRLTLHYAAMQEDCGTSCGSCANIDVAGDLVAYAATSAWDEATVTWNRRSTGTPWILPGLEAAGPVEAADRSAVATVVRHDHVEDTSFVLTGATLAEAWSWVTPASGSLTFLVVPVDGGDGGAVMVVTSREGQGTTCEVDDRRALLEVVVCQ